MDVRRRRTWIRWSGVLLLVGLLPAEARPEDTTASLERAVVSVARAKRILRPGGESAEILRALDEAVERLDALTGPARPSLVLPEAGTSGEEAAKENKRRLREWKQEVEAFGRGAEKLRARWVGVLGEAVTLRSSSRASAPNAHAGLNRRALELLVATKRPDAARRITALLETEWMRLCGLVVTNELAVSALESLPLLASPEAYDWLRRTVVGRRQIAPSNPSPGSARRKSGAPQVDVTLLALRAIAAHEDMPGRLRHAMVRDLLAAYLPQARRAADGHDAERWEALRPAVLQAVWRQAGRPTDDAGEPLGSLTRLAAWFRDHRDRRRDPWKD